MDNFQFIDGSWVVDPDAPSVAQGAKVPNPPYEPKIFPPRSYYDPELNEKEIELFWPKVWTMAGVWIQVSTRGQASASAPSAS